MEETTTQTTWICKRCGHDATTKSHLVRHLNKKKVCTVKNSNISVTDYIKELTTKTYNEKTYDCEACGKKFNSCPNKSRHKKTCKQINKQPVLETHIIPEAPIIPSIPPDVYQKLKEELKKELLQELAGTSNHITNNNTTTNNTNNNTITINLNTFGQEDTSYLTHEFLSYCLLNPRKGLASLIENIHYNTEYPSNHNLRCKSLKSNIFEKYVEAEWRACDASNTLDELIRKGYRILNTHYTEHFMNDPAIQEDEIQQKAYEKFRYLSDTASNDYYAVKRELRVLVKDRTVYIIASPPDEQSHASTSQVLSTS